MPVSLKRIYEPASPGDGRRVLVDRLWPRGLSKEKAGIDEWLRDLAPSDDLRRWYHSQPRHWAAFRSKYLKELSKPQAQQALRRLYQLAHGRMHLTLLYASKNEERNNATVLKELLEGARKPPTGTGPAAAHAARQRKVAARRR
jgi:uncharacterized protein YeaO (DUF488 family)